MTTARRNPVGGELEAARLLLAKLGVTPEQLLTTDLNLTGRRPMPTIGEYLDQVADVVSTGSRRLYETYWNRLREAWGARTLDEPTPLEIKQFTEQVKRAAVVRPNSRGGRSAAEHFISAVRCIYQHAVDDGLITEADNPAIRVAKPRRLASTRRALAEAQLAELVTATATSGNDPELDALIIRFHIETACRRAGALGLRPCDLDEAQSLAQLWEKGGTTRWQPVSPTLMRGLLRHTEERGDNDPQRQLLRYRNGSPITARRYDYLFGRLGRHLPWVATQQVSAHWLRHTTLTWVERHFGYAVARAFAGHEEHRDAGTTATYVRANLYEVAAACAALTGEPHPLATTPATSGTIEPKPPTGSLLGLRDPT